MRGPLVASAQAAGTCVGVSSAGVPAC